jgi:hypothetical protein
MKTTLHDLMIAIDYLERQRGKMIEPVHNRAKEPEVEFNARMDDHNKQCLAQQQKIDSVCFLRDKRLFEIIAEADEAMLEHRYDNLTFSRTEMEHERYEELMHGGTLTPEEVEAGWFFSDEFDGLLIHRSWPEANI